MKTRILSAIIGITFAIGVLIVGVHYKIVLDIVMDLIIAMCVFEGLSAKGLNKKITVAAPCLAFSILFPLFYSYHYVVPILVFLFVLSLFLAMIFNHENLVFPDLSFALTITLLCTLGLWTIVYMFDSSKPIIGAFYLVTSLATPWLADGGAYFGGSFLGKHKLCPKISPKKTIEGAVTGVIVGTLLSFLVGIIFQTFFFKSGESVNYISLAIFGLTGSLISIVGDLSFSLVKRSLGVKDYGSLIPGHGGMLDRFDSVIFTSPLLLIIIMFLPTIVEKAGQ